MKENIFTRGKKGNFLKIFMEEKSEKINFYLKKYNGK